MEFLRFPVSHIVQVTEIQLGSPTSALPKPEACSPDTEEKGEVTQNELFNDELVENGKEETERNMETTDLLSDHQEYLASEKTRVTEQTLLSLSPSQPQAQEEHDIATATSTIETKLTILGRTALEDELIVGVSESTEGSTGCVDTTAKIAYGPSKDRGALPTTEMDNTKPTALEIAFVSVLTFNSKTRLKLG